VRLLQLWREDRHCRRAHTAHRPGMVPTTCHRSHATVPHAAARRPRPPCRARTIVRTTVRCWHTFEAARCGSRGG